MNTRLIVSSFAAVAMASATGVASADYAFSLSDSAPTYSVTLNFDEPGGPTGLVETDAWAESHGITELNSGTGDPAVGDNSEFYPWINDGNSLFANFGLYLTFENDISDISMQVWDPSGGPPFGGMGIFLFNDGEEVASNFDFTPAWGGVGDEWLNVNATDGMVFDEIRVLGFGFVPTMFVDNLSWNEVPAPGALALFGFALAGTRRRRA